MISDAIFCFINARLISLYKKIIPEVNKHIKILEKKVNVNPFTSKYFFLKSSPHLHFSSVRYCILEIIKNKSIKMKKIFLVFGFFFSLSVTLIRTTKFKLKSMTTL